jgi:hypothetical protein
MPIELSGEASGSLTLRCNGRLGVEDILKFHPEIRAHLDDIAKQGLRYIYIENRCIAEADLPVESSRYRIAPAPPFLKQSRDAAHPELVVEVTIGQRPPEVRAVPEVTEFRVNVSSKSFPRAATVDLATGLVTYLHDSFWRWENGWEEDVKRLSDAREVYEVAAWLLDVKKFRLIEEFKEERYEELARIFRGTTR